MFPRWSSAKFLHAVHSTAVIQNMAARDKDLKFLLHRIANFMQPPKWF